jgi:hypothetical protein
MMARDRLAAADRRPDRRVPCRLRSC